MAHSYAAKLRWPDGPSCPRCECREYSYLTTRKLWKCKNRECRYQYSAKVGTIFEDSPLGFEKWLPAIWLLTNGKNGISSHELGRALGVHQETGWHMLGRIRHAMDTGTFEELSGEVEADESFVGGLSRNMHAHKRREKKVGRGRTPGNKTAVFGAIQRDGEVRAAVIPNVHQKTVHRQVRRMVEPGSVLYTDNYISYTGLDVDYDHQTIDHAVAYVEGRVSTNQLENFWALMKRALKGTYVAVQSEHLQRDVTEEVCRFNARHTDDGGRFAMVLRQTEGRRLTYNELTYNELTSKELTSKDESQSAAHAPSAR